jgi:mRNA interferase RelE/StbE
MGWTLEFDKGAINDLDRIDAAARTRILRFLHDRVLTLDNPRQLGSALQGQKYAGIWKYRVGDYRILAEIKDRTVTILVVEIGHRREIYR